MKIHLPTSRIETQYHRIHHRHYFYDTHLLYESRGKLMTLVHLWIQRDPVIAQDGLRLIDFSEAVNHSWKSIKWLQNWNSHTQPPRWSLMRHATFAMFHFSYSFSILVIWLLHQFSRIFLLCPWHKRFRFEVVSDINLAFSKACGFSSFHVPNVTVPFMLVDEAFVCLCKNVWYSRWRKMDDSTCFNCNKSDKFIVYFSDDFLDLLWHWLRLSLSSVFV